ncbi:hypothetical protein PoB_003222300 [Plakobranchus ocellatus]|uniref:Ubiquitin-like domain-containing protein n=1 Tax=Plakobranchus ocellatus TaxID=259542 RepID=A0AAV4AG11_9GAST|nr:hypothetical protein PoB_003222300 [Plakobranchus ocellatus]
MGMLLSTVSKSVQWQHDESTPAPMATDARQVTERDVDPRATPNGSNDEVTQGDHDSDALVEEAQPNIRLLINHELPDGSGNEHSITFNPHNTVSQLRTTMETFSHVPQENIYFIFKMSQLNDSLKLNEQHVESWDCITMRDNRLTYSTAY